MGVTVKWISEALVNEHDCYVQVSCLITRGGFQGPRS